MTSLSSPPVEAPLASASPLQLLQQRIETTLAGLRQTRESFAVTMDRHLAELQDLKEVLTLTGGPAVQAHRPPTRAGNLPPIPLKTDTAPMPIGLEAPGAEAHQPLPPMPELPGASPFSTPEPRATPFQAPIARIGHPMPQPAQLLEIPQPPQLASEGFAYPTIQQAPPSLPVAQAPSPFAKLLAAEEPGSPLPAGLTLFGTLGEPSEPAPSTQPSPFAALLASPGNHAMPVEAHAAPAPLFQEPPTFAPATAEPIQNSCQAPMAPPPVPASPFAAQPVQAPQPPSPFSALTPQVQSPFASPVPPQPQSPFAAPVAAQQQSPFAAPVAPQAQSPFATPVAPQPQSPFAAPVGAQAQNPFAAPQAALSPFAAASTITPPPPAPPAGPVAELEQATLEELNAALARAFSQVAQRPPQQNLSLPIIANEIPATRDLSFA
jgi:hypothetical protein